jgi:hypothetical protein
MAIQFKNLVDVFEQRTGAVATDAYTLTVSTEQTSGATPNPGTGGLKVQYNDGTNDHGFGLVAGTTSSDFLTSGPMHFYTNSDLDTKNATGFAMAIDNFGRVGIGETSPDELLHIKGTIPKIKLEHNSSNFESKVEFYSGATKAGELAAYNNPGFQGVLLSYDMGLATTRLQIESTKFRLTTNDSANYQAEVFIDEYIVHEGDPTTKFGFVANNNFAINTAGSERVRVTSGGSVGIGTNNPQQKLDVNGIIRTNSGILIDATLPNITFNDPSGTGEIYESAGSMIFKTGVGTPPIVMQLKADGALQHGNSSATGQYAAAFGQNNTSNQLDSFATGENTTASGRQSFSGGFNTTASGAGSFAHGGSTLASGTNSFAAGAETEATAPGAAAFNNQTNATGINSFATGGNTTASGEASFALGVTSAAQALGSIASGLGCSTGGSANGAFAGGTVSNANGQFSIAYGDVANASGRASQALGYIVNATANYSFAQGFNNTASGQDAAVFGQQNTVSGAHSISSGFLNTTKNYSSATFGSFNGNVSNGVGSDQFMFGRYLNVPRDSSGSVSNGCVVVGEHNAYLNRPNVKFTVGTGPGVGAEQDSFTVLKDGNVLMEQIVNKNFVDDAAAATGGVPVGGIYHNSGDLKIRLT